MLLCRKAFLVACAVGCVIVSVNHVFFSFSKQSLRLFHIFRLRKFCYKAIILIDGIVIAFFFLSLYAELCQLEFCTKNQDCKILTARSVRVVFNCIFGSNDASAIVAVCAIANICAIVLAT